MNAAGAKKKFVIKSFSIPKVSSDFATTTVATIKSAVDCIFSQQSSTLSFEELYRNAYRYAV